MTVPTCLPGGPVLRLLFERPPQSDVEVDLQHDPETGCSFYDIPVTSRLGMGLPTSDEEVAGLVGAIPDEYCMLGSVPARHLAEDCVQIDLSDQLVRLQGPELGKVLVAAHRHGLLWLGSELMSSVAAGVGTFGAARHAPRTSTARLCPAAGN